MSVSVVVPPRFERTCAYRKRHPTMFVCLYVCSKRPFLARGLGLESYWLPVPRQKFVETAGGVTVGHAL
jgi:hypothetical protein